MSSPLWIAKTGLEAQNLRMGVIANNLANANTVGFKRDRAMFEDLLYQNIRQPGGQSSQDTTLPSGLMVGTGVRAVATEKLHTQGNMTQTERSLDVSIRGRGFFQILRPDGGLAYTRDGSFQMDAQGQLVTANGYPIQPAITIPENAESVTIGADGTVSVLVAGDIDPTEVGTLQLADFINPSGLQPTGENLYKETVSSGAPQVGNPGIGGIGTVLQGSLEASNVNVVEELVNMIETQRTYEMNSKAISTADQMLQQVTQRL